MTDGVPQEYRYKVVYSMVHFAKLWMSFVTERCERGRGKLMMDSVDQIVQTSFFLFVRVF